AVAGRVVADRAHRIGLHIGPVRPGGGRIGGRIGGRDCHREVLGGRGGTSGGTHGGAPARRGRYRCRARGPPLLRRRETRRVRLRRRDGPPEPAGGRPGMSEVPTVTDLLTAHAHDTRPGLRFCDASWTGAEVVSASAVRGAVLQDLLRNHRPGGGPPHIGLLADNGPEFAFLLGGSALRGTVLVGLNPTRRGPALARDVHATDCRLVLTQPHYRALLSDVDVPVLDLGGPEWTELIAAHSGAGTEPVPASPDDLLMLIFTS